jgi:hypothetical protein
MATAGYSGTPLINKLGIKPGSKVLLINEPLDYFDLLGNRLDGQLVEGKQLPDIIHLFAKNKKEFETNMNRIQSLYEEKTSTFIWVSWYKKAAKIPTDLTEDVIREYALKHGLVDVKVCAVSDTWSGLKLVVPVSKR